MNDYSDKRLQSILFIFIIANLYVYIYFKRGVST